MNIYNNDAGKKPIVFSCSINIPDYSYYKLMEYIKLLNKSFLVPVAYCNIVSAQVNPADNIYQLHNLPIMIQADINIVLPLSNSYEYSVLATVMVQEDRSNIVYWNQNKNIINLAREAMLSAKFRCDDPFDIGDHMILGHYFIIFDKTNNDVLFVCGRCGIRLLVGANKKSQELVYSIYDKIVNFINSFTGTVGFKNEFFDKIVISKNRHSIIRTIAAIVHATKQAYKEKGDSKPVSNRSITSNVLNIINDSYFYDSNVIEQEDVDDAIQLFNMLGKLFIDPSVKEHYGQRKSLILDKIINMLREGVVDTKEIGLVSSFINDYADYVIKDNNYLREFSNLKLKLVNIAKQDSVIFYIFADDDSKLYLYPKRKFFVNLKLDNTYIVDGVVVAEDEKGVSIIDIYNIKLYKLDDFMASVKIFIEYTLYNFVGNKQKNEIQDIIQQFGNDLDLNKFLSSMFALLSKELSEDQREEFMNRMGEIKNYIIHAAYTNNIIDIKIS